MFEGARSTNAINKRQSNDEIMKLQREPERKREKMLKRYSLCLYRESVHEGEGKDHTGNG